MAEPRRRARPSTRTTERESVEPEALASRGAVGDGDLCVGRGPAGRRRGRVEDRLARRGGVVELLRAPAALFGVIARVRGALYDRRWLPILAVDVPVISVGNLVAGGTGKTPFVAWLVGRLRERDLRAGILSRGYGPRGGGRGPEGVAPNDEARMLAELLPEVPHVQDRNRVRGAVALARAGVDVIVVDDGFQHRRLARDLDVVLVDASRPFGLAADGAGRPVRALLPRGLLREPLAALRRADAIVLTRVDDVPADEVAALEAELARHAPNAPILRTVHRPRGLREVGATAGAAQARDLAWLAGRAVDLVSGIGHPDAFERTVVGLGAEVVEHRRCPDHHVFEAADFAGLGARPVVITAKDAARLAASAASPLPRGLELFVLDVALELVEGEAALTALLAALPDSPARAARRALHGGLHG